jgi:hypothetical protein
LVTTYNTVLEFNDLAFMHICVIWRTKKECFWRIERYVLSN